MFTVGFNGESMKSSDVNLTTSCSELDFGGSLKRAFATLSKSYKTNKNIHLGKYKCRFINTKCITITLLLILLKIFNFKKALHMQKKKVKM